MRTFLSILVCTCLISALSRVTAADFPRVSGIVGQEGAWVLAIIETGAGECTVISRGETYGTGIVAAITSQGIEVRYPDHSEFLPLKGGAFVTLGETDPDRPAGTPRSTANTISREEAVATLALAEKQPANKKGPAVNEALGLPLTAQITFVNSVATSSQQEAGRIVREELEKGHIPRINVSGVPGLTEIYLVPDTPFKPIPPDDAR